MVDAGLKKNKNFLDSAAKPAPYCRMTTLRQEDLTTYVVTKAPEMVKVGLPEIRLTYRPGTCEKMEITSPEMAVNALRKIWSEDLNIRESCYILFLDIKNVTLGYTIHSVGGINRTDVDIRLIFTVAVGCGASSIVFAHNHPSGDVTPSPSDRTIVRNINSACNIMNITLQDSIILGEDAFFSFRSVGIL